MKLESNGLKLEFHSSIKDLPNSRHFKAKSYSIWNSALGGSIDDVRDNLVRAMELISQNKPKDAITCIQNADLGIEAIKSDEDFLIRELICYLKSFNGVELDNILSDTKIEDIYIQILESDFSYEQLIETLSSLKKK